jgi:uncharacterized surface protein with fasciclin (FAS1) repeats
MKTVLYNLKTILSDFLVRKNKIQNLIKFNFLTVILAVLLFSNGCQKYDYQLTTSSDKLIGQYLDSCGFSLFIKMLDRTNNLAFLNTYGTYTCFAPINAGVEKFLAQNNYTSIDDIPIETLKDIVRYHLIKDTISSSSFNDGKLPKSTMLGHYLTVNTYFENGIAIKKINKKVKMLQFDIHAVNGIIHTIEDVIVPPKKSVAELLEEDARYSIFVSALKETGLYDTIKQIPQGDQAKMNKIRWFTVFAESDSVYNSKGIFSVSDLINKYSSTGNPKDPTDSMYLYVAYHVLDSSLKYVADIILNQAHLTLVPLEIISVKLRQDTVFLNEVTFMGRFERGSALNRAKSDNIAANGVFHDLNDPIYIKVRFPERLYWDVCDQPEIRKIPGVFRKPGMGASLAYGQLANITWSTDAEVLNYTCDAGEVNFNRLVYNDYLQIWLRQKRIKWVEFKTPIIVKGTYKVWICCRNQYAYGRRPKFQVTVNGGNPLANIIDNNITFSNSISDDEMALQGFKRYIFNPWDSAYHYFYLRNNALGQLAGTVNIPSTGVQTIRFTTVNDGDTYGLWLDMIQFIPAEEDQLWPRITINGEMAEKPEGYDTSK